VRDGEATHLPPVQSGHHEESAAPGRMAGSRPAMTVGGEAGGFQRYFLAAHRKMWELLPMNAPADTHPANPAPGVYQLYRLYQPYQTRCPPKWYTRPGSAPPLPGGSQTHRVGRGGFWA